MIAPVRTLIAPEIAERYGRALNTVQTVWMPHERWPRSIGKRGRWNAYDEAEVEQVVRSVFLRAQPTALEGAPDDLLTVPELAAAAQIAPSTLRAYISRQQVDLGDPDDETGGVKRWRRAPALAILAQRRRHKQGG
ncbi:hypothetical protein [Nocardia sp. NPDC052566]|uniref:hypothetical protein n=1 Tax=Nocardia sp. NPDC052566 TaxID=3364330 RepID=UPI0037CB3618